MNVSHLVNPIPGAVQKGAPSLTSEHRTIRQRRVSIAYFDPILEDIVSLLPDVKQLQAVRIPVHSSPSAMQTPSPHNASPQRRYSRNASIALIGMSGVGKTTLASIVAKALGWEMLDTDAIFKARQHRSIREFIATDGYDAVRQLEAEILAETLRNNPLEKVIACGAGVIELEKNREVLKRFRDTGLVIHILREKDAVLSYMQRTGSPHTHHSWDHLTRLFRECCSFEFASLTVPLPAAEDDPMGSDHELSTIFKSVEIDFFRLLRFIHGVDTNKVPFVPHGHRTYLMVLTYDDINRAIPFLDDLSIGIDLWAIRVDLLASYDLSYLSFQVATLRRHSPLPIMFILRTKPQVGNYPDPDPNDPNAVKDLVEYMRHALRLGMEYVEIATITTEFPGYLTNSIIPIKGNSSIMGMFFDFQGQYRWDSPEVRKIYDDIVNMGVDIVGMVLQARSFEDNVAIKHFVASIGKLTIPLLAINMGNEGKLSRALNHYLCPVAHPLLPKAPFPGYISYQECQSFLHLTGLLPPKNFYLFGHPIGHSMSAAMYNSAFAALCLPYVFNKLDTPDLKEVQRVMERPDFGGATVTLPHGRSIMPLVQHLTRHARFIGAVNIIFPAIGGHGLWGDNIDCRSIKNALLRSLTPAHPITSSTTALVLGAGGAGRATVYALYNIGVVNIFVFNRTREAAQTLANDFQQLDRLLRIIPLDDLDSILSVDPQPTIIVSTVPASSTPAGSTIPQPVDIGLRLEHLSPNGGVAVELAYQRRITPLLAFVEQRRSQGSQWTGVEGVEVLLEQGYEACRIWTGRRAPSKQVRAKVLEVYNESYK